MTTRARGPRTLKGALVSVDGWTGSPKVLAFQYNPATLKRQLKPLMVGGEPGDRSQAVRILGAPTETLSVEIEFDAVDGLETQDPTAVNSGIQPHLAAFELLVFPTSLHVIADAALLAFGTIEIAPATAPRLLFVWGPNRVQPIQINSYSITEDEFDARLNPIRATVALEMRVLTYSDLSVTNADYFQYLAYQHGMESAAKTAARSSLSALGSPTIL